MLQSSLAVHKDVCNTVSYNKLKIIEKMRQRENKSNKVEES